MGDYKGKAVNQLGGGQSVSVSRQATSSQIAAFTGKKKTKEELDQEAADKARASQTSASDVAEEKRRADEQLAANQEKEKKKKRSAAETFMASSS